MRKITKAVFPVAGRGSRFLPVTKVQPKEMLPIVDKPLIQYAVEEAISAGINELIFITGRHKRAIEDHFDKAYELEAELESAGKFKLLERVQKILPPGVNCVYIRQPEPVGLGHAVLCARPVIGDEPFAVLLADDLMVSKADSPTVMQQMVDVFEKEGKSILAVEDVARDQTHHYGIVNISPYKQGLDAVNSIVEKPLPDKATSTLASIGRYILDPAIFSYLEKQERGHGNEIQLTDAIAAMVGQKEVCAYHYDGLRFDCGSKLGYLKAAVTMGLKHPETKEAFRRFLKSMYVGEE